jgi:hypothetical protein
MTNGGKASSRNKQLIEENLRRVYQEKVDEDVPDRFKDLLQRLKSGDDGGSSDK